MISSNQLIKKRILLIGSNGLLGGKLAKRYYDKEDIELLCCSLSESSVFDKVNYRSLDITNKKNVKKIVKEFYPDIIINAASFTDVDACETDKNTAWNVNVTGVENLVKFALISDAHLIQLSSDYVFDGTEGPYSEEDKPNPINYYGRTKLAAENLVRASHVKHTIIRTNVLYDGIPRVRPDFAGWVINSLKHGQHINVVNDQINNPTFVDDVVKIISRIVEFRKKGIFNVGGSELLSRYEFAIKIADYFGFDKSLIAQAVTSDLKQIAPRPLKSGLINLKSETELGYKPSKLVDIFSIIKRSFK